MGIKEYLEQVVGLEEEIESKRREIVRLTSRERFTEEMEIKMEEYRLEAEDYINRQTELYIEIANKIMELEDYSQRIILRERYIHGRKWEDIAETSYYGISNVHNIHNQALEDLEKIGGRK